MAKSRGVRGAAGACAAASLVYLLGRSLLALLVSALMGLAHPGASLAKPLGFSDVSVALFQLLVGIGAIALTLAFLLKLTRLRQVDLRIALPAPWSPGFCPTLPGRSSTISQTTRQRASCCPAVDPNCLSAL